MADENLYRVRAERGEVQLGTWVNMIRTPSVLMLLRAAGLDFARIDMEHSPFSMETVADMAALARAMNFPMVVRPPHGNREWITRLLDAGVWNLHVPQVDTPEQAREVAACCRYTPLGDRGMYGFGPNTEFQVRPLAEHTAHANARVHDDHAGIEARVQPARRDRGHSRDRCADDRPDRPRPGSRVLGTPAQNAALDEHRQRLVTAARKHGKAVAMLTDSAEGVRRMIELGATIINYSSDAAVLRAGYASTVQEIRRALPARS
jgi:2-keto-3-deoxy-L-rhamnonate aldolase RhmA